MSDATLHDAAAVFGLDETGAAPAAPNTATTAETAAAFAAVQALIADMADRRIRRLTQKASGYARSHAIASDVDPDGCLRRQVYEIERWQDKPVPGPELQARFDAGNVQEREGIRALLEDGFTVTAQQTPFEHRAADGRVLLRGRIDGKIEIARGHEVPFEIKSMNVNVFNQIETAADLKRFWWCAKYEYQLQCYLIGHGHEAGFLWLTDCLGHWKAIPIALDLDLCERIFQFAEKIDAAVQAVRAGGEYPAFSTDPEECTRCPFFKRTCNPDIREQGAALLDDPGLELLLIQREELAPAAKAYNRIDDEVKATLKAALENGAKALVGDFAVELQARTVKIKAKPATEASERIDRIVRIVPLKPASGEEDAA